MSRTYDIACTQCRKALWIGQASVGQRSGRIYSGESKTMAALNAFLWEHRDHPLIFTDDEKLDDYDRVDDDNQEG